MPFGWPKHPLFLQEPDESESKIPNLLENGSYCTLAQLCLSCPSIRAETTKIESYNDFLDWVSFGGPVVKSGDPVEQEKQIKYASLVANTIMLSNVTDLTEVLSSMIKDGIPVTPSLVACLSPYARENLRRFGRYDLDMDSVPEPLRPRPILFEPL